MAFPFMLSLGALACLFAVICARLLRSSRHPNFPPGPPRLPVVGNLHQLPLKRSYLKLTELGKKYGSHGLMGMSLGQGQHVIVINSWKAARDLLEERGAIYSSRPRVLAAELVLPPPGDYHLALLPYGEKWRRQRRTVVEFLREAEMEKRRPIHDAESSQLMIELLQDPGRFEDHVFRYHGAIILASVFGMRAKEYSQNTVLGRFFAMNLKWSQFMEPGACPPCDVFPFLKYVPEFLLPMWRGWRERGQSLREGQQALYGGMLNAVRTRLAQGQGEDCYMARLLRTQEKDGYSDVDIAYIGGLLIEGGSDTTAHAFLTFVLAMATHPQELRKAQEEVDRVFGDEMPTKINAAELPFLSACFWEILRWRPGMTTALPHYTTQDDVYEGFVIPAETMILLNVWAISQDAEEYENPDMFDPSRFLRHPKGIRGSAGERPDSMRRAVWGFGAGRRVCVGQGMAQESMLMTMAKLVWCFDVEAAGPLDTSIDKGFRDGIMTGPEHFKANFHVRGGKRKRVMQSEWEKADRYLKQFE